MEGDIIMKKVSFRVRNFDKEQFLTFDIDDEAELDEELLDFLEDEEPRGIVPVIFEEGGEEQDTFSYNITDRIHICELSNQEINAEMVLRVMWGLVRAFIDMAEYRVPLSYLVLHRNYIYIDSDYRVEFICIPLNDMQEQADVNSFFRNLIASLRFDPSENGDYVAKLLSYVNNRELFNLHNMLTLVEELMEEYGIEIPEDSEDIYADYEEVEEKSAADIVDELEEEDREDFDEDMKTGDSDAGEDDIEDSQDEIPAESEETIEETVEEQPEAEKAEPSEEDIEDEVIWKQPEKKVEIKVPEPKEKQEEPEEEAKEPEEDTETAWKEPEEAEEPEEDEAVWEQPEEAEEPEESKEDEVVWEQPKEAEDLKDDEKTTEEAQEIVEQLKNKVKKDVQAEEENEEEPDEENGKKKGTRRPVFKTKETQVTGVVIQDELDEFLAEKEREEQEAHREESNLKIKKNIKINRASIVKNSQEEQKEAEEAAVEQEETEKAEETAEQEEAPAEASAAPVNAAGPKANPYLIRVNTDERIMITKQTFKLGKASMGVDYTVKGNGAVSRVHAIITCKDGVYSVKDNKSTNHTFVNGKLLEEGESADLSNDSKIVLGDEEFIFKLN